MSTNNIEFFEKYSVILRSTSPPVVRDKRLLMDTDGSVDVYYAPFEYINPKAKIILVGITPGPTQMVNANNVARQELIAGASSTEAIKKAKEEGAFSGELMRSNLIKQLDHWGFHTWLDINSSSELFGNARHLVQTTSLLRYPVFVNDDDYRGTPNMTKNPLLRKYLMNNFVKETHEMKDALFLGLGPQVQKVLDTLVYEGLVKSDRLIRGLLHPSGNCTYRINYMVGDRKQPIPHATNPDPYDHGRADFRKTFLKV